MAMGDKLYQAIYLDWLARQLAKPIDDPFKFAYNATERQLGKRTGWPAIHALTTGIFAGLGVDVLSQTGIIEVVFLQTGQWVGSGPAFVVGVLTYLVHILLCRTWHLQLDHHVFMALERHADSRREELRASDGGIA